MVRTVLKWPIIHKLEGGFLHHQTAKISRKRVVHSEKISRRKVVHNRMKMQGLVIMSKLILPGQGISF